MEIEFLGHAGFRINNVLIDPWIKKFPVQTIPQAIIITHDHFDHHEGAFEFANKHNIPVIGTPETIKPAKKQIGMNIGGPSTNAGFEISFVQALHTANPTGAILKQEGKTVYHTGDTGLFSDMKLIGELHKPDVMLVCVGGNFTMDIYQAAQAVAFVKPRIVIPMHYDTFPTIQADTQAFKQLVEKTTDAQVQIMRVGDVTTV
ncbi:MAG: metal-dependent hydrolase [Candidatus Woesearchaeota archaeon]